MGVLFSPGGLSLSVGRPVNQSLRFSSRVTALSGLGNAPGIRFPRLIEACSGSRSQFDESRTSTRRSVWSRWSQRQSEGPKRRLDGHLPLGRRDLYPGEGALRRSEPMGPRGTPMYLCPWHDGVDIRMDVG